MSTISKVTIHLPHLDDTCRFIYFLTTKCILCFLFFSILIERYIGYVRKLLKDIAIGWEMAWIAVIRNIQIGTQRLDLAALPDVALQLALLPSEFLALLFRLLPDRATRC